MNFFSVQRNFEANLYSTYVVKVSLEGIIILGRRDWTITKVGETPLKVKCPLTDTPQAYELTPISHGLNAQFWKIRENNFWTLFISKIETQIHFHVRL